MILFKVAQDIVSNYIFCLGKEEVDLSEAHGRVLSDDVLADRDMPPFDKSAVDGYACLKVDLSSGMNIIETIAAGFTPIFDITNGACSKIMTGGMIPSGADCVIMVEDTTVINNQVFLKQNIKIKENICKKGEDLTKGDLVLSKGTRICAEQIAILAALGVSKVPVASALKIGIMSTGDEIVEPNIIPKAAQIRNSNGWQLRAQALSTGAMVVYYGIAADNQEILFNMISKASEECDIVILTGGVSMGDFDYVPSIIKQIGFDVLFDKVAVQPGKPSTFAVKKDKVIFALPGNPVSSFIQFELLVKPFIYKSMGSVSPNLTLVINSTQVYNRKNTDRLAFVPVFIGENCEIDFLSYNGSAHISALNKANAIAEIPIGVGRIEIGDKVTIYIYR